MEVRRWLLTGGFLLLAGCQSASQPATSTTIAPPSPTAQPSRSTTVAVATAAVVASAAPEVSSPAAAAVAPPAAGASRVETLNAADAAFGRGDLNTAAGLYDRVVNTPPTPGEEATASVVIDEFARFRGFLTLLADGREDEARASLAELQSRAPNSPLARLGSQVYDQYGMTGQLRSACAQVQPQVATVAGPTVQTLQRLGVTLDPSRLCSAPGASPG